MFDLQICSLLLDGFEAFGEDKDEIRYMFWHQSVGHFFYLPRESDAGALSLVFVDPMFY